MAAATIAIQTRPCMIADKYTVFTKSPCQSFGGSLAVLAALLLAAASCAGALERASTRYKQDRDDAILQTIVREQTRGCCSLGWQRADQLASEPPERNDAVPELSVICDARRSSGGVPL